MEAAELLVDIESKPTDVIASIRLQSKDSAKILTYQKEYKNRDRSLRDTQVDRIQKNKQVGSGENLKEVKAVRIPVNFAKKIVTTSVGFEIGKPVTLIPSEELDLATVIKQLWKVNRVDSLLQKLLTLKKSETQGAIQCYIQDVKEGSLLNKILVKLKLKAQKKEIKVKILDNTSGTMTPVFNALGDMLLFMWEYQATENGKAVNFVEIWDKEKVYYLDNRSGTMGISATDKTLPHGFDRIPIVYVAQDDPEWFVVREIIDRLETTLSKIGASNDYSAYPLLQIFGDVKSFPDKDEAGKTLQFPITPFINGVVNPFPHGKAEFLEAANAVESQKLELDSLENFIYSISQTPNVSFDNVKGLGAVSGVALKLMFLDAIIKAATNEGENRTMIERLINILISGTVNTTNTNLKGDAEKLYFDIQFNSIIPDDLKEAVEIASSAKEAGLASTETLVKYLGFNEDTAAELALILKDKEAVPAPTQ